jgi:uncharacterized membrane protein
MRLRDPGRGGDGLRARDDEVMSRFSRRPLVADLSRVHTRNERKIVQSLRTGQDVVADKVTAFAGSLQFVYLHAIWFAVWIALNVGVFGSALVFDEYPYGLLTMIVSLEAIFLSTFVMVSQNRQAARADLRAQLDFETNLRSEVWSVHIGKQLGLDPVEIEAHVQRLIELSTHSTPAKPAAAPDPAAG